MIPYTARELALGLIDILRNYAGFDGWLDSMDPSDQRAIVGDIADYIQDNRE